MPYTDQDLEKMLGDIEADWVERKSTWLGDAPEKARQAVCAFANDLPDNRREGVLFVGVRDDGQPVGLDITDSLLQTLAGMKTDGKILPPPSIVVEKRLLLGHYIAIVRVRPSDSPPVRYDGRTWIRIGPRRAVATIQEERVLSERRQANTGPFDVQPCEGSSLGDLDLRFVSDTYLTAAIDRAILEENGRSTTEQLSSIKFLRGPDDAQPTVLGMLVAGKSPQDFLPGAYVQFARFAGTDLTDEIVDAITIMGRLDAVLSRTEEKFTAHNSVSVDLTSSAKEGRKQTYPLVAFQQVFRNAVMHRVYEHTNTPVRVSWYSDRLEIVNPGGPFGIVSQENFGRPGITDYRNPNLAEAMRNLGYAQRFGVGIATAKKALSENGSPNLSFETNQSFTILTLRPPE